ncbi:hypothetical protein V6N13_105012 [Hibiscus sabdariffa]
MYLRDPPHLATLTLPPSLCFLSPLSVSPLETPRFPLVSSFSSSSFGVGMLYGPFLFIVSILGLRYRATIVIAVESSLPKTRAILCRFSVAERWV